MKKSYPLTPKDLSLHIIKNGLHMHFYPNPPKWQLISGDTGYKPCNPATCFKIPND